MNGKHNCMKKYKTKRQINGNSLAIFNVDTDYRFFCEIASEALDKLYDEVGWQRKTPHRKAHLVSILGAPEIHLCRNFIHMLKRRRERRADLWNLAPINLYDTIFAHEVLEGPHVIESEPWERPIPMQSLDEIELIEVQCSPATLNSKKMSRQEALVQTLAKKIDEFRAAKAVPVCRKKFSKLGHKMFVDRANQCLAYLLLQCGLQKNEELKGNVTMFNEILSMMEQMKGQLMRVTQVTTTEATARISDDEEDQEVIEEQDDSNMKKEEDLHDLKVLLATELSQGKQ